MLLLDPLFWIGATSQPQLLSQMRSRHAVQVGKVIEQAMKRSKALWLFCVLRRLVVAFWFLCGAFPRKSWGGSRCNSAASWQKWSASEYAECHFAVPQRAR
ncbi:MAG: hypothetical protein CMJ59_12175 [Planctomycetaceae bacterium]|nr:hypothetical protein [Planctomycetaceae bacterium]